MLKELEVKDFAIIENVNIKFREGFNVLTGQTGAGKSLIIDTISLLLGARADTYMIRFGREKAYIKAIFSYENKKIDELLEKYNIEKKEDITLERIISKTKSVVKINDLSVSLQTLVCVTENLANLHSQTDTYKLFNKDNYLSFIDDIKDENYINLLNDYLVIRSNYLAEYNKLNEILKKNKESKDNLEYLESAYKEISSFHFKENEKEEIEEKIKKMENFDKIYNALKESYSKLENEYTSLDNIYDAYLEISKVKQFDSSFDSICINLDTAYSLSSEALKDIKENLSNLEFDPEELDNLNLRLNEIENLELKYHKTFDELIKYQAELKLEIDLISNYDAVIKENEIKLKSLFDTTLSKAIILSKFRKKVALKVEKEIIKECIDLDLLNTEFKISFEKKDTSDYKNKELFKDNGIDDIDFLISLNKGEPLIPLSKCASGGEMSRIMLSFKSYYSRISNLSLMVFDEIDTGVSGEAARKIAKKMYEISKHCQVISITHLATVAARADNQFYIYKEEENNRTLTRVKELNEEERVIEIAKMISGERISEFALEEARDMINNK